MYELKKEPFGPFTRYTLLHEQSGNRFSIVPERGANVLEIVFSEVNILDGYTTPEELRSAKWGKSVLLFPFPNRLNGGRYRWQNKDYVFPINNAATGNAIHGFVRDEAFEVDYIFLAKDHASILCSYDYDGRHPYYPFSFRLEVEFLIRDDGSFTLETACRNLHDAPIPLGFGWHPYFRLAKHADLHAMQLPACKMVLIDERMIPTGERTQYNAFSKKNPVAGTALDNCFATEKPGGQYRMTLEADGRRIAVKASATRFPYFQVFTPPHRESIALEPMSCNVDAFNNGDGLIALDPGKEWKAQIAIEARM